MLVMCALPWFIIEQRRPGLTLPPGTSLFTIGFRQAYVVARECFHLKQTFLYLIFYFLMYVFLHKWLYVLIDLPIRSGVLFTTM